MPGPPAKVSATWSHGDRGEKLLLCVLSEIALCPCWELQVSGNAKSGVRGVRAMEGTELLYAAGKPSFVTSNPALFGVRR